MGTFNAGAIEATLTLDRTPFNKSMDAAQARAKRFEAKGIEIDIKLTNWADEFAQLKAMIESFDDDGITIPVDIQEFGDGAEAYLRNLKRMVEDLDGDSVNIPVDVDAGRAGTDLVLFNQMVENLDGDEIDIPVDVDSGAAMAKLAAVAAAAEAVDNTDVDIDVNAGGTAMAHFTRFQAIVTAVLVLLPLVPPVAATATAAVMGLAAGLTAAAGALGVVGLGVAPTITGMMALNEELQKQQTRLAGLKPGSKEYIKQAKKVEQLQKRLKEDFGAASEGMKDLSEAWSDFGAKTRGASNELIGQAFQTLAEILPRLVPIFNAAAPVIEAVFDSISDFVDGPEMDRVVTFFEEFGSRSLGQILRILGNVIQMFGRLFEAFAPFGTTFLGAIEDVTAAWADWADGLGETEGFKDFIDYVMLEGPKVWDLIKNIIGAFINLGVALAPVGTLALDVFNSIFGWIATVDPSILGALAVGLMSVVAGFLVLTAVTAAFNAVMGANPIGLVVIAVFALVGAITYLWNTNEGFREAVINIWNSIVAAVQTAVDWFTGTVIPFFQSMWEGIVAGAMWLWGHIGPIFTGIADIIVLIVQVAMEWFRLLWAYLGPLLTQIGAIFAFVFKAIWETVSNTVKTIWSIISNTFNVIMTFIKSVLGVLIVVFQETWNVIKTVVMAAINIVKAILQTALNIMRGNWSEAWNGIKNILSTVWNAILDIIKSVTGGIGRIIASAVAGFLRTITSAFQGILNVIRDTMENALTSISNIINNIKGLFGGAGSWLIDAGRRIIQGLIDGIKGAIGGVKDLLSSVTSWIPDWKGPAEVDAKLLYDNGKLILRGLIEGVRDTVPELKSALNNVTGEIPGSVNMNVGLSAAPGSLNPAGGSGNTYHFNFEIKASDLKSLQQIDEFVNSFEQQSRQITGVEV